MRVYSGIYLYVLAEPFALNTLGQVEPRTITLGPLTEPQGEAIGYDHMGLGFWTISGESKPVRPHGAQLLFMSRNADEQLDLTST